MSMNVIVALLVCIVGALVHLISTNGKVQPMGLYAFAVGLLVTLLLVGGQRVSLP